MLPLLPLLPYWEEGTDRLLLPDIRLFIPFKFLNLYTHTWVTFSLSASPIWVTWITGVTSGDLMTAGRAVWRDYDFHILSA